MAKKKYGRWAVVTGASDGIGREFAYYLAASGLDVVLVARRREVLETLADELRGKYNVGARVIAADLAKTADIERVLAETQSLDVGLFVAAAGFGTSGELISSSLAAELDMLDVNCRAVLAMTHAYGQRFAAQGRGGIVLMSSLLAFQGVPRAANYAATKAYIQSFAEGLRIELAPRNVDVIASAPGPTATGFATRASMNMSMAAKPDAVAVSTMRALGRSTTVRPGFLSKFLEWSLSFLPRFGRVRVLQRVMAGMTKHVS